MGRGPGQKRGSKGVGIPAPGALWPLSSFLLTKFQLRCSQFPSFGKLRPLRLLVGVDQSGLAPSQNRQVEVDQDKAF